MIVVTGASGQVGTAFRELIPGARFLTRAELDLTDLDAIPAVLRSLDADAVVNCAAYTAVDRAEEETETAELVNGRAVGVMAEVTAGLGIPFVTYSTDYVFAGDAIHPYLESDPTDPINAYGRSKELGERLALAANPRTLVVRTSWVVSGSHPNFVATMLRLARDRTLRVVDDQTGCPTVAADLAAGTLAALDAGATGILHLTNRGETTWFRLARRAVELAGIDPGRIEPCTTDEYPTLARRPAYSVLGSERRAALGLTALPFWEESLPGVVERILTWL